MNSEQLAAREQQATAWPGWAVPTAGRDARTRPPLPALLPFSSVDTHAYHVFDSERRVIRIPEVVLTENPLWSPEGTEAAAKTRCSVLLFWNPSVFLLSRVASHLRPQILQIFSPAHMGKVL